MKNKIDEIHTFGTSHTKGGGFEWHHEESTDKVKLLKRFYGHLNIPKTQHDFSWPGQLSNILNIKVQNHAKSGFGDERMYRKFYELSKSPTFYDDIKSKLFIFEFAQMGRKEYFSNTVNDYVIFNYWGKNSDGRYIHDYLKFNEDNLDFNISNDYDYGHEKLNDVSFRKSYIDYFKKSYSPKIYQEKVSRDAIHFLCFLENISANYLILSEPFLDDTDIDIYVELKLYKKEIDFKKNRGFLNFIENNSISKETNNGYRDGHAGFEGNKEISKRISDKIINNYNIIEKKLL